MKIVFFLLALCLTSCVNTPSTSIKHHAQLEVSPDKSIISSTKIASKIECHQICIKKQALLPKDRIFKRVQKVFTTPVKSQQKKLAFMAGEHPEYLLASLAPKPQTFTVNAQSEGKIVGEEGTIINIPANCFVDENGITITGKIEVQLTEMYTASDLLTSNMSTKSDHHILETGGTLKLEASQDGKSLQMSDTSNMNILFPVRGNPLSDMRPFVGKETSKGINWEEPSNASKTSRFTITKTFIYYTLLNGLYLNDHAQLESDFEQKMRKQLSHSDMKGKTEISYTILPNGSTSKINIQHANLSVRAEKRIKRYFSQLKFATNKGLGKNPFAINMKHYIEATKKIVNYDLVSYNMSMAGVKQFTPKVYNYQEQTVDNVKLINGIPYYSLNITSFGFINCDRFRQDSRPKTGVIVLTKAHQNAKSFIILPTERGILTTTKHLHYSVASDLPVGENVFIVSINYVDGDIYYGIKKTKLRKNHTESITLLPISKEGLANNLYKLDQAFLFKIMQAGNIWRLAQL